MSIRDDRLNYSLINVHYTKTFEKWYTDYANPDLNMLTYEDLRNALNIEMGMGPDPKKKPKPDLAQKEKTDTTKTKK